MDETSLLTTDNKTIDLTERDFLIRMLYTVSQKMHQLWNGIAQNYRDRFWWFLAEIFKSL